MTLFCECGGQAGCGDQQIRTLISPGVVEVTNNFNWTKENLILSLESHDFILKNCKFASSSNRISNPVADEMVAAT
jgi:hypothetical protein